MSWRSPGGAGHDGCAAAPRVEVLRQAPDVLADDVADEVLVSDGDGPVLPLLSQETELGQVDGDHCCLDPECLGRGRDGPPGSFGIQASHRVVDPRDQHLGGVGVDRRVAG